MSSPKSIKTNHQRRTDRREVHSRPTGVSPQGQSRRDLNRQLIKIHQRTGSFGKVQEELLRLHWENNLQPQWFITCYGRISRLDLKPSSVTPDTSGMCSWPRCWTNPSRNFLNHPLDLIWCSSMNGNQWSLEDDRSLHSTPICIWVLYLTLWTTSGIWITWFIRRPLQGSRNSSRPLQRGIRVWWSNHGTGTTMRSTTWRTTTPTDTIRIRISLLITRIQIWCSRENK